MKHYILFLLTALFFVSSGNCQSKDDYYKRASKLYDVKDYNKALENINRALKLEPTNGKFLLLKANSLETMNRFQEAYDTYTLAIEADAKDAIAYNQRGLLQMRIQEPENSIKDFSTALEFETRDSIKVCLLVNRGAARIDIRDFQDAYGDFVAALQIDSLSIGTLNNLATVCDEIGKGDQTLKYLFKIIQIDSTFVGAYGNIGFKYQQMGDFKTALKYFNKVLELDKNEPLAYSNRSYNYYKLGEFKLAMADINHSLKLYPSNSYAYRIRALIFISMKEEQKACMDLEVALTLGFSKMYGEEVEQLKKEHCK